jgi:hypothetical protein
MESRSGSTRKDANEALAGESLFAFMMWQDGVIQTLRPVRAFNSASNLGNTASLSKLATA